MTLQLFYVHKNLSLALFLVQHMFVRYVKKCIIVFYLKSSIKWSINFDKQYLWDRHFSMYVYITDKSTTVSIQIEHCYSKRDEKIYWFCFDIKQEEKVEHKFVASLHTKHW